MSIIMSNFSFSNSDFKRVALQTSINRACWERIKVPFTEIVTFEAIVDQDQAAQNIFDLHCLL